VTIAAIAVLAGCAGAAGSSEPVIAAPVAASELHLELGKTVVVEGGALEVTFSEIASDSRCPRGETCVWEGDAVVRFAVRSGAETGAIELHTSSRGARTAGFAGWRIELVALEPEPVAAKPVPQTPVATLRVERGDATDGAIQ
jgi:hypothetical protein